MKTAAQWKSFYASERAALGEIGLAERLERAPEVTLNPKGALVFPHTRLSASGDLTAAVAKAVLRTGASEVLAIGVLHNGVQAESAEVARARGGDATARASLRRVHLGGDPFCGEEFSLDNFGALLDLEAKRSGRPAPKVHARFPFLVEGDPGSLPGLDEVEQLAARMPVVATTDPLHHGVGYGTPEGQRRAIGDESTLAWARDRIDAQLDLLARGAWKEFAALANDVRSDFRDAGPVLASVRKGARGQIVAMTLVDYCEALEAEAPTWVAAPLVQVG